MSYLNLITQPIKKTRVSLELFSSEMKPIAEMEGDLLDMSLSIDSQSDIRRTANISMHMDDKEYFESTFVTLWLNRLIRLQIGIYDMKQDEYYWFLLGSFMVTQTSYQYNAQSQQLNLMIADLMAAATEERGSQIGAEVTIEAGESIQASLEGTVEQFFPFNTKTVCDFEGKTVPYDLEFERGIYPYDISKKIVELYPTYEQFYDINGVYKAQGIPIAESDPVVLTANEVSQIVISDEGSVTPGDIRNVTEVWGRELDADHTAETCDGATETGVYKLFIDDAFEVLEEGKTFSFTPDVDSQLGQRIQIQETPARPIYTESGDGTMMPIERRALQAGLHYVVKYTNLQFVLQGESEVHAVCLEFNERPTQEEIDAIKEKYACNNVRIALNRHSNFSVEKVGQKVRVLQGDEYDNISTSELALERAAYENWRTSRVQDTIQLTMLYVPWLDVNQKIEYKSIVSGETAVYLIKSIEVSLIQFTMVVSLVRFYPYYPWLRQHRTWGDVKHLTWGDVKGMYWDELAYSSTYSI